METALGLALIMLAGLGPLFWFFNANEQRAHEEQMKRLEIERLRIESRRNSK